MLQKNYGRKEEKKLRYLLNFNFIFRFHAATPLQGTSSWTIKEQSRLPNNVLKCTCRFHWLIRPNSVWSSPEGVFFNNVAFGGVGSLAAHMAIYQAKKPNHHLSSLLASVQCYGRDWSAIEFLSCTRKALYLVMSGASRNFNSFWIYFILFALYIFSNIDNGISTLVGY